MLPKIDWQKFQVGKKYIMTFITDSNLKISYTVIKRTPKTITIMSDDGKTITKRIRYTLCSNSEVVQPLGNYSMSPHLLASNEIKEQQETKLDQNADCWLWMCGE